MMTGIDHMLTSSSFLKIVALGVTALGLAACTSAPANGPGVASPTSSSSAPTAGSTGTQDTGCAAFALIEQGLTAIKARQDSGQVDQGQANAMLDLVAIQILQASTVLDTKIKPQLAALLAAGPGTNFHPSTPTVFDPTTAKFETARSAASQACHDAGFELGVYAVRGG